MNSDTLISALKQLDAVQLNRQRWPADNPHVVVDIGRSKNKNEVIYEGKVSTVEPSAPGGCDKHLAAKDAIHPYWSRYPHEGREDLGFFEKKAAYGCSTVATHKTTAKIAKQFPASVVEYVGSHFKENTEDGTGPVFTMTMVAFKQRNFFLCMHKVLLAGDKDKEEATGDDVSVALAALEKKVQWLPVAIGELCGKAVVLERIWVQLLEGTQDKWIPTVEYVDVTGALLSDNGITRVRERLSTDGKTLETEIINPE